MRMLALLFLVSALTAQAKNDFMADVIGTAKTGPLAEHYYCAEMFYTRDGWGERDEDRGLGVKWVQDRTWFSGKRNVIMLQGKGSDGREGWFAYTKAGNVYHLPSMPKEAKFMPPGEYKFRFDFPDVREPVVMYHTYKGFNVPGSKTRFEIDEDEAEGLKLNPANDDLGELSQYTLLRFLKESMKKYSANCNVTGGNVSRRHRNLSTLERCGKISTKTKSKDIDYHVEFNKMIDELDRRCQVRRYSEGYDLPSAATSK